MSVKLFLRNVLNRMPFYAVARGRVPGVYMTWDQCNAQVDQFSNPMFKKFLTESEAKQFVRQFHSSSQAKQSVKNFHSGVQGKKHVFSNIVFHGNQQHENAQKLLNSRKKIYTASKCSTDYDQPLTVPKKKRKRNCSIESHESVESQKSGKHSKPGDKNLPIDLEGIDWDCTDWDCTESHSASSRCSKSSDTESPIQFDLTDNGYVKVYTDGACSKNGFSGATAGVGVWFGHNHPLNVSEPVIGRATNNKAEIDAVRIAATQAKKAGVKKLEVITDSQFVISCCTQWLQNWKRNGWKTASLKPVKNREELTQLDAVLSSLDITWKHVNGHQGILGNEMADQLARAGCTKYKSANKQ